MIAHIIAVLSIFMARDYLHTVVEKRKNKEIKEARFVNSNKKKKKKKAYFSRFQCSLRCDG